MPTINHNPALYRELSEPISRQELEERLDGFFKEVKDLRIKHKLPDVHVIIRADVKLSGDLVEETRIAAVMTSGHLGDPSLVEGMCAWAFGRASADHATGIDAIKADGRRAGLRDRRDA